MCDINNRLTAAINKKFKEVQWLLNVLKTNFTVSKQENTILECILQDCWT